MGKRRPKLLKEMMTKFLRQGFLRLVTSKAIKKKKSLPPTGPVELDTLSLWMDLFSLDSVILIIVTCNCFPFSYSRSMFRRHISWQVLKIAFQNLQIWNFPGEGYPQTPYKVHAFGTRDNAPPSPRYKKPTALKSLINIAHTKRSRKQDGRKNIPLILAARVRKKINDTQREIQVAFFQAQGHHNPMPFYFNNLICNFIRSLKKLWNPLQLMLSLYCEIFLKWIPVCSSFKTSYIVQEHTHVMITTKWSKCRNCCKCTSCSKCSSCSVVSVVTVVTAVSVSVVAVVSAVTVVRV